MTTRTPRCVPKIVPVGLRAAAPLAVAIAICCLLGSTGCGVQREAARVQNVKPPRAGTPAGPSDVSGIYRSLHQAVLQLRGDGSVVLIDPSGGGPSSGTFTLFSGRLVVRTPECGDAAGTYDVAVTGPQQAGKASLVITAVGDTCTARRTSLTRDSWVYADS